MQPQTVIDKLIPILYEDDAVVVVDKPAGIDAAGTAGADLCSVLAAVRGRGEAFEPINRLSRYESGILLLTRTPAIGRQVRAGLRTGRVVQEYVAIVLGRVRQPRLSLGDAKPPARSLKAQRAGRTIKGRGAAAKPGTDGRTTLSVLRPAERRTLVSCRTTVRNTHTLRAQLRAAGLRLLGDHVHDPSSPRRRPELTCLHLARVTFDHPTHHRRIGFSCNVPPAFQDVLDGRRDVERHLYAALVRRLPVLTMPDTDAYRLLTGDAEGVKGLIAERYGPVVTLQSQGTTRMPKATLRSIARWYLRMLDVDAVYARDTVDDGPTPPGAESVDVRPPRPLAGVPVPERIVIHEGDLQYSVSPYRGSSVGLFLDHRDNRQRVRGMARDRSVLNLFAYTCGFSVAAAAGGAHRTVSVDLSTANLDWGRDNFRLNNLDLEGHTFVRADAADYLKRAGKRGDRFELIILDPPTFAHGRKRGRHFSIARDLADLVRASAAVLEPGGVIVVATNYRRMSLASLLEQVKRGAGRLRFRVLEKPELPADFAVDPDHARTVFVRMGGASGKGRARPPRDGG
jgi:23S rRNA (cytosine1962-C5)-methyltransferase